MLTDDQVAELRADVRQYSGLDISVSTATLAALLDEREALRARVAKLEAVVEAARQVADDAVEKPMMSAAEGSLIDALAALEVKP
jgi:hypothetical protein